MEGLVLGDVHDVKDVHQVWEPLRGDNMNVQNSSGNVQKNVQKHTGECVDMPVGYQSDMPNNKWICQITTDFLRI